MMAEKPSRDSDPGYQRKLDALKPNQFKPGQSGNPSGRPKGSGILGELRKSLDKKKLLGKPLPGGMTAREAIAEAILFHVVKGNAGYFRTLMEYVYGRMPIKVQTSQEAESEKPLPDDLAEALMAQIHERMKGTQE